MADPKIRYDVEANATGAADVNRLAVELEKLDKSIDPAAAARAEELAGSLRQLGQQQAAIDTFVQLKDRTEGARVALQQAQEAAQAMGRELAATETPTRAQTGQMAKLADAVKAAKDELQRQTQGLDGARAGLTALGLGTDGLAKAQVRLRQDLQAAREEAARLGTSYQASAAAIAEGAAAVKLLEEAAARAEAETQALAQTLNSTEAAASQFAAATERAAAALSTDTDAIRTREAAAQRLLDSDRALTSEQRELANARNAGRAALVAEADALNKAATAARESAAATQTMVDAARRAGAAIESAFGATGVRSLNAIETEIEQTSRALTQLEAAARRGDISVTDLARAAGAAEVKMARLRAEMQQVEALPNAFERVGSKLNDLFNKFGLLTAAIATLGVAVRPAVESFIALETTTRILQNVTGSATAAGQQVEFLRNAAQRSGQSFDVLAESYSKFAVSALQNGLTLKQTQDVFASLANASGQLGISTEKSGRALEALSQIASKGTVSMEELRGQLGDALPGVLPALAKELGLTTAELGKVVETGGLLAGEAIPAIGRALDRLSGAGGAPVKSLTTEFERLKNVALEATNVLAQGAFGSAIGAALGFIADRAKEVSFLVALIGESFTVVGKQVGATFGAIATLDFSNLRQTLADIEAESGARLDGLASRISGVEGASSSAARSAEALGKATQDATLKVLESADATDRQSTSLARVALDNAKAVEGAVGLAQAAEKLVDARKKEGEALTAVIGLAGDEVASRVVGAEAARSLATAADALAAAEQRAVDALLRSKEQTIQQAAALGLGGEATKKAVEELDKLILARSADAEKAQAQASATRAAAAAAELALAAVRDNAGQYAELSKQVDAAREALIQVSRRYAEGRAASSDLERATIALYTAKGKLKDALDDQEKASKRVVDQLKAESEVTKAQLELQLTGLRIQQQELTQRGLNTAARQLGNQIADLELQLTAKGTEAKRAEANEIIRSTTLRLEALRVQGLLTPALEQELRTRILQQQAIVLQTDASVLNERQLQKENEAVRNGTAVRGEFTGAVDKTTTTLGGNTGAVDRNTDALGKNADAATKATSARKLYDNLLRNDPGRLVGGNGLGTLDDGGFLDARNAAIPKGPTPSTTRTAEGAGYFTSGFGSIGTSGSANGIVGGVLGGPQAQTPAGIGGANPNFGGFGAGMQLVATPAPAAASKPITIVWPTGGSSTFYGTDADADRLLRAIEGSFRAG